MEQELYENLMNAITVLSLEVQALRKEIRQSKIEYLTLSEAEEYTKVQAKRIMYAVETKKELVFYSPTKGDRVFKKADLDRWLENSQRNYKH